MAAKFTYDINNKLFILNSGVTDLDIRTDLYSDAKEDWLSSQTLNKLRFPILAIGGQSIGGGQVISPYFQLRYGWKIRPHEANHSLTVTGNLITDDDTDPLVDTIGDFNIRTKFITSSNSISVGGIPTAIQNAEAILDKMLSDHSVPGSVGSELKKKLSKIDFIALKD